MRDRFVFLAELGRGGMGVVYRARDPRSGRDVALKTVRGSLTSRRLDRFRREGRITASLQHPGIVQVHEAGEADGSPWLAYELVEDARTFGEVLSAGQPRTVSLAQLRDAARAVGHAHARGVVHRDLKPSNVLVDAQGRARVADFGLATAADVERLTQTGALVGTLTHMAPEQVAGERDAVGPATDVWALGVMLYEVLTGRLPFEGESFHERAARIYAAAPTPPRRVEGEVAPELEAICLQALAKEPSRRFPDGEALARDLDRFLAGEAVGARRPARPLGRLALAGVLALPLAAALLAGSAYLLGTAPAREGAAAGPPAAPLRVVSPAEGAVTNDDAVTLRGTAPVGARVEVRRGSWRRTTRAREGRFAVRVPLRQGENRLAVRLLEAGGAGDGRVERSLRRRRLPDWFEALPEGRRPPLPLPDGLRFGPGEEEYENARDASVLVWIPAGTYRVGVEESGMSGALPAREVTLDEGFFMGKHEVTRRQYARFAEATGRSMPTSALYVGKEGTLIDDSSEREVRTDRAGPRHPVVGVHYAEAEAYCDWAGVRLPSEVEWECAARGPTGRVYPWGDREPGPRDRLHNGEGEEDGYVFTAPVGSFPEGASPFGCLDMAGNVFEWTTDVYEAPDAAHEVPLRVMRGGAFNCSRFFCRATYRDGGQTRKRGSHRGFRVCRDGE